MSKLERKKIRWYKSLGFLGILGLTLIPLWDMVGIYIVLQFKAKELVLAESSRVIEESGNNAVLNLTMRARQIEALTRNLAKVGELLPRTEEAFKKTIPPLLDFNGDHAVAGGGIWPEPFAFDSKRHKRSFFYGREKDGTFKYYDDYNSGRGYIHDEWYPVVKYSKPGNCFWSKSYMDPYSHQPMVTCTVAMREKKVFKGVATIDLKLEGLHEFLEGLRKKTGGYLFLLDRNNKFLTFPKPELVQKVTKDATGKKVVEFQAAQDFAAKEKLFVPINAALNQMNLDILEKAGKMAEYKKGNIVKIDKDSDQISKEEAKFIAAVIADPLKQQTEKTYRYRIFEIKDDFLNKEKSIVYLFHVPQTYWKLVIVKPFSEAAGVAALIANQILLFVVIPVVIGVIIASFLLHFFLTKPVSETTDSLQTIGQLVAEKKFDEIKKHQLHAQREDELGQLAHVINALSAEVQESYSSLMDMNENLENLVADRTKALEKTLRQVSALKNQQDGDYFLTSLLLNPLGVNFAKSSTCKIDFIIKQKKKFTFKGKKYEIGGDLCIGDTINLRGREYLFFINADAMGKSMQGAGGALILGAIVRVLLERAKFTAEVGDYHPERWLHKAYLEMHRIFETFEGSMMVSGVFGLVDTQNGFLCYVNAEHPWMVIYRKGKAEFMEGDLNMRKFGHPGTSEKFKIRTFQLLPGDQILAGSDGKDDLLIQTDINSSDTHMNEDEKLFLDSVVEGDGNLKAIYRSILSHGNLSDDLTLMSIDFLGNPKEAILDEDLTRIHELKRQYNAQKSSGNTNEARALLESLRELNAGDPNIDKALIRGLIKEKKYTRADSLLDDFISNYPEQLESIFLAAKCATKLKKYDKGVALAEKIHLRQPQDLEAIVFLAELYHKLNQIPAARDMSQKGLEIDGKTTKLMEILELTEDVEEAIQKA